MKNQFTLVAASPDTIELIKAIAELWPLSLVVFLSLALGTIVLFFKPQVASFLTSLRNLTLKRGETEVSINAYAAEPKALPEMKGQEAGVPKLTEGAVGEPGPEKNTEKLEEFSWEIKMHLAVWDGNFSEGEKALENLQKETKEPSDQIINEARFAYLCFEKGEPSARKRIKDLEERAAAVPRSRGFVVRIDAKCYEFIGDRITAIERYRESAALCVSEQGRVTSLAGAADCLYKEGQKDAAIALLTGVLKTLSDPEASYEVWVGLAEIFNREKDYFWKAIARQKALSFRPNSPDAIFAAAYACSEADLRTIAVVLYEKLVVIKSDYESALNNLGVSFSYLKATSLVVDQYKRAIKNNDTLAAANLANLLVEAGDLEQAETLLTDARKNEKTHQNVHQAGVRLHRKREEDLEIRRKAIDHGGALREFLNGYSRANEYKEMEDSGYEGKWRDTQGEIGLEFDALSKSCKVIWTTQVIGLYDQRSPEKLRFIGKPVGRSIRGDVEKWKPEFLAFNTPGAGTWEGFGKGYAYFSDDGLKLAVFVDEVDSQNFYRCDAIKTPDALLADELPAEK